MMNENPGPAAFAYALRRELVFTGRFGAGLQGKVWKVRRKGKLIPFALKLHLKRKAYLRERDCYLHLAGSAGFQVEGFNLPALLHWDDAALALELTIVDRPFVLDFAQTWLHRPPDFPVEVWEERWETWAEVYGDDWPRMRRVLAALEALGVWYLDVHPGNIAVE